MAKHRFDAAENYLGWVHEDISDHPAEATTIVSAPPLPDDVDASTVRLVAGEVEYEAASLARGSADRMAQGKRSIAAPEIVEALIPIVLALYDAALTPGDDTDVDGLVAALRRIEADEGLGANVDLSSAEAMRSEAKTIMDAAPDVGARETL